MGDETYSLNSDPACPAAARAASSPADDRLQAVNDANAWGPSEDKGDAADAAAGSMRTLASQAGEQISGLIEDRIAIAADVVDEIAEAARNIAAHLDDRTPRLAGAIRNVARDAEDYARDARGKSASELLDMTTQFARRRPALFAGAAMASGFLIARFLKTTTETLRPRSNSASDAPDDAPGGASGDERAARPHGQTARAAESHADESRADGAYSDQPQSDQPHDS